ncbi:MAG: efflux RND transporter periplasmic adaptor subunit [Alphaproteobacteria bacterium]
MIDRAGIPEVSVEMPTSGPAVRAVYATGIVEPETWAEVSPLESGRIISIVAFENDDVVVGEPLALLDDKEAKAIIGEFEARLDFLKKEVARTRQLLTRNFVSEKAHEQALSEYREVLAALAGARVRRDNLVLRAPLSGKVLRRDGEIGEVIDRGQPIFWVGAPRPLRIEAEVDEEDIPLVRAGQTVKIKSDAFPDAALEGTVGDITPKGDPVNKSFRVHIDLPDNTPLMIGMTTETNIVVEQHADAILVPTDAVRGNIVWTVENGRAVAVRVEIGVTGHSLTQITGGLDRDRPVIADPPLDLQDNDRVRVRRRDRGQGNAS